MQFEELLKLVREVGQAGLTDFEYQEGNIHIRMSAAAGGETGHEDRDYNVETNIPVTGKEKEDVKTEVIEAPIEGVFFYARLDGTPCPLAVGDRISAGQVLGMMESRGQSFEVTSVWDGEVINIYIDNGEEIVAREPMFRIAV